MQLVKWINEKDCCSGIKSNSFGSTIIDKEFDKYIQLIDWNATRIMEKINDKPKKILPIRRARCKQPNDDVSNERRQALIDLIMKTNSIRCAAK